MVTQNYQHPEIIKLSIKELLKVWRFDLNAQLNGEGSSHPLFEEQAGELVETVGHNLSHPDKEIQELMQWVDMYVANPLYMTVDPAAVDNETLPPELQPFWDNVWSETLEFEKAVTETYRFVVAMIDQRLG